MNLSNLSLSQKLTLGVTVVYVATSVIHAKEGRKGLSMLFAGYSIANIGAIALEG